jgi:hypothetical protein
LPISGQTKRAAAKRPFNEAGAEDWGNRRRHKGRKPTQTTPAEILEQGSGGASFTRLGEVAWTTVVSNRRATK